jgi:hypothetical protein
MFFYTHAYVTHLVMRRVLRKNPLICFAVNNGQCSSLHTCLCSHTVYYFIVYGCLLSVCEDSGVHLHTHMPMPHIFNSRSEYQYGSQHPIVTIAATQKLSCFCERPQPQGKSLEAQVLAGLSNLFNQFVISSYVLVVFERLRFNYPTLYFTRADIYIHTLHAYFCIVIYDTPLSTHTISR